MPRPQRHLACGSNPPAGTFWRGTGFANAAKAACYGGLLRQPSGVLPLLLQSCFGLLNFHGSRPQPQIHPRNGWHRLLRQAIRSHRFRKISAGAAPRGVLARRAEAVRDEPGIQPGEVPGHPLFHWRRARPAAPAPRLRGHRHRDSRRRPQAGARRRVQPDGVHQNQHFRRRKRD